jgi:SAM-dependent methyltransferase
MAQGFRLDKVDFEGVYQGKSLITGADMPFAVAPWDIGAPQPAVVGLVSAGAFHGEVLDVGCGLGENAIFLAGQGLSVTGVDGAETALRTARERAAVRGVEVTFVHTDVTTFDGVDQRFDTVLDSALYHCLDGEARTAYAEALWRVTNPGATLHLLCFADVGNDAFGLPMTVSQDDLRAHLAGRWRIRDIEPVDYTVALTTDAIARIGAERLSQVGMSVDLANIPTDDQGRVLARMWHLHADRGDQR